MRWMVRRRPVAELAAGAAVGTPVVFEAGRPDLGVQVADRVKVPRAWPGVRWIPNQTSTRLSHDPEVGVKWTRICTNGA